MSQGPEHIHQQTFERVVPTDLATRFLEGSLTEGPPRSASLKRDTYPAFEGVVTVPGLNEPVSLRLEIHNVHAPNEHPFTQVRFDYLVDEEVIAEMHWSVNPGDDDDYDLTLAHREVKSDYRDRSGIGTSLYRHAEAWAQDLARAKQESIRLGADASQKNVLSWLTKNGYVPHEEDAPLYKEYLAHPERFEIRTTDYGPNDAGIPITREQTIYPAGSDEPLRIRMRKTLSPS